MRLRFLGPLAALLAVIALPALLIPLPPPTPSRGPAMSPAAPPAGPFAHSGHYLTIPRPSHPPPSAHTEPATATGTRRPARRPVRPPRVLPPPHPHADVRAGRLEADDRRHPGGRREPRHPVGRRRVQVEAVPRYLGPQ